MDQLIRLIHITRAEATCTSSHIYAARLPVRFVEKDIGWIHVDMTSSDTYLFRIVGSSFRRDDHIPSLETLSCLDRFQTPTQQGSISLFRVLDQSSKDRSFYAHRSVRAAHKRRLCRESRVLSRAG